MSSARHAGPSGATPGRPGGRAGPPTDGGQAAVELVLVVPVVVLLALLLVQVGQVVHHQLLVVHVAREAARAAAVAGGELDRGQVPGLHRGLDPDRVAIDVVPDPAGGTVQVRVVYRDPTDVALVGGAVPDVELDATVVMRTEG